MIIVTALASLKIDYVHLISGQKTKALQIQTALGGAVVSNSDS